MELNPFVSLGGGVRESSTSYYKVAFCCDGEKSERAWIEKQKKGKYVGKRKQASTMKTKSGKHKYHCAILSAFFSVALSSSNVHALKD